MHTIRLKDDYIKLGQALKVNGQTETQRGKKLVSGDKVEYDGETIVIE